jgi:HEPN domain-containing protein
MDTTEQPTTHTATITFKQATRLSSTASRAASKGVTPDRCRIAREAFELALRDLINHDEGLSPGDTCGITDVLRINNLLVRSRQEAMAAGILTSEDVSRIERKVRL